MPGPVCYCRTCGSHFVAGETYIHANHDTEQCSQKDYDEPLEDDY